MSDDFNGQMIGLDGKVCEYPEWFFKKLQRMHRSLKQSDVFIIERDRKTGHWRILPAILSFKEYFETPNFNPKRTLHASDPEYVSGRSKDSGRALLWSMIGGLTTPDRKQTDRLRGELDDTPPPRSDFSRAKADQIVREVKAKRRAA